MFTFPNEITEPPLRCHKVLVFADRPFPERLSAQDRIFRTVLLQSDWLNDSPIESIIGRREGTLRRNSLRFFVKFKDFDGDQSVSVLLSHSAVLGHNSESADHRFGKGKLPQPTRSHSKGTYRFRLRTAIDRCIDDLQEIVAYLPSQRPNEK